MYCYYPILTNITQNIISSCNQNLVSFYTANYTLNFLNNKVIPSPTLYLNAHL